MPSVSVIIPCYNEEATIQPLLEALYAQTYPREALEVIISDGMSTDRTREVISSFQTDHPDLCIRVVDNPARNIPSALNRALESAIGKMVVRLDGHCLPRNDYIERCVDDLQQGAGDLVGGVWEIQPGGQNWVARSIARVAAHPLGVGDARYRYANQAGPVDTVPFGAYYLSLIDRIGKYDVNLLTNEDYEFATRVRQAGGRVWMDPSIRSVYFARKDLGALARQYWRYGYWKWRMLRRYPGSLRWRQALPPLFLISLIGLALLSIVWPVARVLLLVELIAYWIVLVLAGVQSARRFVDITLIAGIPLGIATMHFCWGAGFLWSMIHREPSY